MIGDQELHNRFSYHPPTGVKIEKHQLVRDRCFDLAVALDEILPDGRDKMLALTHLEQVMYSANASIARND